MVHIHNFVHHKNSKQAPKVLHISDWKSAYSFQIDPSCIVACFFLEQNFVVLMIKMTCYMGAHLFFEEIFDHV